MTPLLQQAREALELAAPHHLGFHSKVGHAINAAIASLDAHEAMSEYDKAVEALAPYLPDGWVAQDEDGEFAWFSHKPTNEDRDHWGIEGYEYNVHKYDRCREMFSRLPRFPDWRISLREIRAGRVVPQGEGGRG